MAKLLTPVTDYTSNAKKVLILGEDGVSQATVLNPLPVDAVVTVNTMTIDTELSEKSGHDYYVTTTNLGDGTSALMEFTADLKENVTTQGSAIAISNPVTLGGATHKLWLGGTLRQVGGAALSSQTAGTYASDAANGGGNIVVNVIYN